MHTATLPLVTPTTQAPVETTHGTFLGMEGELGFFRTYVQGKPLHGLQSLEGVKVLDPEYRTSDERRWEVQAIRNFGLIKAGETFTVARNSYGLALFRKQDIPSWTQHPILSISADGVIATSKFFAAV